jgi:hypothetical protein
MFVQRRRATRNRRVAVRLSPEVEALELRLTLSGGGGGGPPRVPNQVQAAVAMDAAGDSVVVWQEQVTAGTMYYYNIDAQRYNAAGAAVGPTFQVNGPLDINQEYGPDVAMDAEGDFVVAWQSIKDPSGAVTFPVVAQRYDFNGNPLGSNFVVSNLGGTNFAASVAMDAEGDFVVAYEGFGGFASDAVFAHRYDSNGTPLGPVFRVNTVYMFFDNEAPNVAMDSEGDFVVTWQSDNYEEYDDRAFDILAQRYDLTGAPIGGNFLVNSVPLAGFQLAPDVAMDSAGGFVVVWEDDAGRDGSGDGVFGQLYDPTGVAVGGEFQVNQSTYGNQYRAAVAMSGSGQFVVTWESFVPSTSDNVYARTYDATGTPTSAEFIVNWTTSGPHQYPDVAMDSAGDFVVVWEEASPYSSTWINHRRY